MELDEFKIAPFKRFNINPKSIIVNPKTMKKILVLFSILLAMNLKAFCITDTLHLSNDDLKYQMSTLRNEVQEIRRDQLNYLIEKDLLKEAFSTNYQTINIVITVILGIFVVLGYIGIRDINAIKEGYEKKLKDLIEIQNSIEKQQKEFISTKEKSEKDLGAILTQNDEQNKKIKVLELREKIANLIKNRFFTNALEYIGVALDIIPDDIELLRYKAFSNLKLNRLINAIASYEKLLTIEKSDSNALMDLGELYLLSNDLEKFEKIFANNKSIYFSEENKTNSFYLESLYFYKKKDEKKMKEYILEFLKSIEDPEAKKVFSSWDFNDVRPYLLKDEDNDIKKIMISLIDLLDGKINKTELESLLK